MTSRPAKPANNQCPYDEERDSCNLTCKYNVFRREALEIHSWELGCLDCGLRQTIAWRSDDEDDPLPDAPDRCPFCEQCGLAPGKNPCENRRRV